ncbi:MAG: chromosomal replication initiator protein DnaA [Armatimonadota bacterium]
MPEPTGSAEFLWEGTLDALRDKTSPATYETVFKGIRPSSYEDGTLRLQVRNQFAKEWLVERHLDVLQESVWQAAGARVDVAIEVADETAQPAPTPLPPTPRPAAGVDTSFPSPPLNPKYTFENFVEGNSNRFAHAMALNVANGGARGIHANPLFVWGGAGVGKTHLMQAIGHHVLENYPGQRVVYVSGETFVNHVVTAIRDKRTADLRRKYRSVDVWLVDDVQFIAAKDGTRSEEEFFHTFNTLHETDKQIVMSSDQPPRGLQILDERLRSRFESGSIVDIKRPDVLERIAILQRKAENLPIHIPMEVFEYIARITWNIRVLEGALTNLLAWASINNVQVTPEIAEEILKDYSVGGAKQPVTIDHIVQVVASHFGVRQEEMLGPKRSRAVVLPRQVAMYVCRELTNHSLVEIGKAFGGRDHSTVLHACAKIGELMDNDDHLVGLVNEFMSQLQPA